MRRAGRKSRRGHTQRSKEANRRVGSLMKEFGSPWPRCLPLLVRLRFLFALFATLPVGPPWRNVPYT